MGIINLDSNKFKELIEKEKDKVIIVDFWAPWCGPCKMIAPVLEEIQEDFKDKNVIVTKINVDENHDIVAHFQIRSIPTVMFIKNKTIEKVVIGANPRQIYYNILEKLLKN
jgi:thioredoxin 1